MNTTTAQTMTIYDSLINTINSLFVFTDKRIWEKVESCFAPKVLLDYSSMGAGEPTTVTPQEITASWKELLPGFESTHHTISNHVCMLTENGKEATVICYVTAIHYLPNNTNKSTWTVVGSYDFQLLLEENMWKIQKMKLNFKWQEGNTALPNAAKERVKQLVVQK